MAETADKLHLDAAILAAMAAQTAAYLDNDRILFWPLAAPTMPRLTLGGFLLRRHRLVALFDLLPPTEQATVQAAMAVFNQALEGRTVRFEKKAQRELASRIRQWAAGMGDYLAEARRGRGSQAFLATTMEVRAMIAALMEELSSYPYHLDRTLVSRVAELDRQLRGRWVRGPFIWPESWAPAYPADQFWWLYGQGR